MRPQVEKTANSVFFCLIVSYLGFLPYHRSKVCDTKVRVALRKICDLIIIFDSIKKILLQFIEDICLERYSTNNNKKMSHPSVLGIHQGLGSERVNREMDEYYSLFNNNKTGSTKENETKRKEHYDTLASNFYDLVTDFYEYGWGESFHFAPRHNNESFNESIARYELYIALRLGLKPGMKVLDVGCGVGGPQRTIARYSG